MARSFMQNSYGRLIWYTSWLYLLVCLLIIPPNTWWGIPLKILAVLMLIAAVKVYTLHPFVLEMLGSAGAGR